MSLSDPEYLIVGSHRHAFTEYKVGEMIYIAASKSVIKKQEITGAYR